MAHVVASDGGLVYPFGSLAVLRGDACAGISPPDVASLELAEPVERVVNGGDVCADFDPSIAHEGAQLGEARQFDGDRFCRIELAVARAVGSCAARRGGAHRKPAGSYTNEARCSGSAGWT